MPEETLLQFITANREQGRSEDVIREFLFRNGWSQDQIEAAFKYLSNPQLIQSSPRQPEPSLTSEATSNSPAYAPSHNSSTFNLLSYRGRIGRLRYFLGSLVVGVLSGLIAFFILILGAFSFIAILGSAQQTLSTFAIFSELSILVMLLVSLPCVLASSLIVKRFHDLGRSGAWWFALLIPIYNIYLSIGLFTERGAIGPNQYGEDPLPPDMPQSDALDRVLGKNALVKIVLTLSVLAVWIVAAIIYPRSTSQQRLNVAVNQTLSQPDFVSLPTSSVPIATSLPSNTPASSSNTAQKQVSTLPVGWTTVTVLMASSSQPTCYTIDYPSTLKALKYGDQPGSESFLRQENGFWNGVIVEPDFSDTYGSILQQQEENGATPERIITNSGLAGTELKVAGIEFWEIFFPVSQNGVNYVVAIYPANRSNPYDPSVAEAMAQSLAFACKG